MNSPARYLPRAGASSSYYYQLAASSSGWARFGLRGRMRSLRRRWAAAGLYVYRARCFACWQDHATHLATGRDPSCVSWAHIGHVMPALMGKVLVHFVWNTNPGVGGVGSRYRAQMVQVGVIGVQHGDVGGVVGRGGHGGAGRGGRASYQGVSKAARFQPYSSRFSQPPSRSACSRWLRDYAP